MNIKTDGKLLEFICMYMKHHYYLDGSRRLGMHSSCPPAIHPCLWRMSCCCVGHFKQCTATITRAESCKGSSATEIRTAILSAKLRQSNRTDKGIELTMQLLHSFWTVLLFEEQMTWKKLRLLLEKFSPPWKNMLDVVWMYWKYRSKILSHCQKTLRSPWCPKLVTGLRKLLTWNDCFSLFR